MNERPIRVAQVMGKMNGGGVESVVMNYYRHIDRNCVQFDFLVDGDSSLVPREEIEDLGGRVIEIPPYQKLSLYRRELGRVFASESYRLVHSHINALSVFPLSVAKKEGVAVRIAHSHSASGNGEYAKNAAKNVLRRFSNVYPTHKLACSRYAGEWLFGKGSKFEVLYNAIELDRFRFNAEARGQARADLGLVGDAFAVGHVGRFMAQKNHGFLIEAFAELVKIRPDSILLCAGSGEEESSVECLAAERGVAEKVRFLGQRNDIDRLYQAFDAFALPSLYEGLCLVGVEAQAAGLPCLLSDTITREVDVTGNVRFLSIKDPQIWARALCEVPQGRRMAVNPSDLSAYDIEQAALFLQERYLSLCEEAGIA